MDVDEHERIGVQQIDVISVRDLIALLWRQRTVLLITTLVVTALAVAAAVSMSPVYRAQITLLPVDADSRPGALSGLTGQIGGLAALAGISMGGTRRAEAVALLNSQAVIERFIEENNLLPVLFAGRWDAAKMTWKVPPEEVPTIQDGYRMFDAGVRRVVEDSVAGTVTLEIFWGDRELAASWANEIVRRVNETMRTRTIEEAQRSVNYLEGQLKQTDVVDLRAVLFNVMQDQITSMTLAKSREEFGLRVIDPAIPPAEGDFVSPRRKLIIVGGFMVGFLLGALVGLVRARVI